MKIHLPIVGLIIRRQHPDDANPAGNCRKLPGEVTLQEIGSITQAVQFYQSIFLIINSFFIEVTHF